MNMSRPNTPPVEIVSSVSVPAATEASANHSPAVLDLGQSVEYNQLDIDDEYKRAGTMEYEPPRNIRTNFGRVGPDARVYVQDLNPIHMTPRGSIEYHPTNLQYALDVDGIPLRLRGDTALRRGQLLTPAEKDALFAENPDLLKPVRRERAAEWRWRVSRRRTGTSTAGAWCRYFGLCGDAPGPKIDEGEWPGAQMITESRNPHEQQQAGANERAPKVESEKQQEFKKSVFQLLTAESGGKLDRARALKLAGLWGYVLSELDKKRFVEKTDKPLGYRDFEYWLQHSVNHPEDRNLVAMQEAFAALDFANTGKISLFALETLLTTYGEALTSEEVAAIVAHTGAADAAGYVKYRDFLDELWAQNRKLPPPTVFAEMGVPTRKLPPMVETEVAHF